MTTDVDTVIERRRLRRRLTVWRGLAITGIVVALFALGASGDHLSDQFGNKQIARVAVEGTILESRDQLELLKRIGDASSPRRSRSSLSLARLPPRRATSSGLAPTTSSRARTRSQARSACSSSGLKSRRCWTRSASR